jgi:hypothetical protein
MAFCFMESDLPDNIDGENNMQLSVRAVSYVASQRKHQPLTD